MKKVNLVFKMMVAAMICGVVFTSCGGGGVSAPKSGLPSNELLGNLPALYADNQLAKEAELKKLNADREKAKNIDESREAEQKMRPIIEKRETEFREAVAAEWKKIDGKDVPFSASEAFNKSKMQVNSVKFNAGLKDIVIDLVAKEEFKVSLNNLRDYDQIAYRVLAKDGSVIATRPVYVMDMSEVGGFTGITIAAGQSLFLRGGNLEGILNVNEDFVNFAKIEFIAQSEK